jgi:hypothetical protein
VAFPVAREDRPVGPLHHLRRVWTAGSLPALCARSQLPCDVQNYCASNQGLMSSGHLPPDSRTASNLAKTMTLSRYLRLAAS